MIKKTLYFGNPAYLSLSNRQMVIQKPEDDDFPYSKEEKIIRTIPVEDIGVVVLDNRQITITSCLISELLANNVAVITCTPESMPQGLLLPLQGNTLQNERFLAQIEASLPLKKQLWQQTVSCKIRNQAQALKYTTGTNFPNMIVWAESVRSGDPENLEARAAAYYWKNIFPKVPYFVRGRDEEPPNNLLNYGYAILRAVIARALVSSGLLPTLGIHHHNRYNAYCLADDIMEPYRPFVDKLVFDICEYYDTWSPKLITALKSRLLEIPAIDVEIEGKRSPLMIAATTTSASLFRCFNGSSKKISYPSMK